MTPDKARRLSPAEVPTFEDLATVAEDVKGGQPKKDAICGKRCSAGLSYGSSISASFKNVLSRAFEKS